MHPVKREVGLTIIGETKFLAIPWGKGREYVFMSSKQYTSTGKNQTNDILFQTKTFLKAGYLTLLARASQPSTVITFFHGLT